MLWFISCSSCVLCSCWWHVYSPCCNAQSAVAGSAIFHITSCCIDIIRWSALPSMPAGARWLSTNCFSNSVCAVGTGWSARCALYRLTNLVTHSCCDAKPKRIQPHPSACLPVWIHLRVHFEKYYSLWYNRTGWLGVKLQATFFWNTVTEVLRLRCYIFVICITLLNLKWMHLHPSPLPWVYF